MRSHAIEGATIVRRVAGKLFHATGREIVVEGKGEGILASELADCASLIEELEASGKASVERGSLIARWL